MGYHYHHGGMAGPRMPALVQPFQPPIFFPMQPAQDSKIITFFIFFYNLFKKNCSFLRSCTSTTTGGDARAAANTCWRIYCLAITARLGHND